MPTFLIGDYSNQSIPAHNVLCAGFLCQAFSKAASRQTGTGTFCPFTEEELDFIINYDIKRGRGSWTLSPIPHTQNKKQCNFTFPTRDIIEDFTSGLHKPTMNELQFILYNTPEGNQSVQVVVKDETLWCTQKAMSQLFGVGVPAISKHLNHIFEEGELNADTTVSKMEIVVF